MSPTLPRLQPFPTGLILLAAVLLGAIGCATSPHAVQPDPVDDPHSYANFNDVRLEHIALDLEVDFDARRLDGSAALSLAPHESDTLILDIRDLEISAVTLDSGESATWTLGESDPRLGQPLEIGITPETRTVTVSYRTDPDAEALQWLPPDLTAGGEHPFMFSQSQAILARTWVPCQDSPAVRITYDATVTVPAGLMAVMSARNQTDATADGVYRFSMPQAIPSYLLAIAVGDLEFREIGPRSGVYAEPPVVEAAAWEFADTERMIEAAERLYGSYPWERYDILVLPPSFPWGGMENPRLTFATPTILAGDRSLVALVAHELAHSWSGNLVTNATWNDFWLNEGFTSYIENRLMEELYGTEYAHMLAALDLDSLRAALAELEPDSPDSHLVLDLSGRDPDEGMSEVAYNKGASFLRSLEYEVGRERWDQFLTAYFDAFGFQSIDTPAFIDFLHRNLLAGDDDLAARARVNEWIYGPGLPENLVVFEPAAFDLVAQAIVAWREGAAAADLPTSDWTTHHWLHFLRNMPDDLSNAEMAELDGAFAFTSSGNSEILAAWFGLAIEHGYEPARPAIEAFLTTVGRLKFLYPLYEAILDTGDESWARAIYSTARPGYHPVTAGALDRLLGHQPTPAADG